eukprot:CAMPEP_0204279902 /NCGR_PEP_ID=MMETSP0468-20130131/36644_1 /ASSEMBLY_ACC=CAM_ASM_000383 /TAXON_ID=2969 /ORGANISM="Oxyrrhis marina" /LENGTH=79 /DNA_ID=CAMNT_0051257055 /DNA_START=204 /DNA_END=443 /DNA_ORIENTATION=+
MTTAVSTRRSSMSVPPCSASKCQVLKCICALYSKNCNSSKAQDRRPFLSLGRMRNVSSPTSRHTCASLRVNHPQLPASI